MISSLIKILESSFQSPIVTTPTSSTTSTTTTTLTLPGQSYNLENGFLISGELSMLRKNTIVQKIKTRFY